ncbi:hypothetical protein BDP27DRAFT_1319545, partial [Rhodocollybia butyracea]
MKRRKISNIFYHKTRQKRVQTSKGRTLQPSWRQPPHPASAPPKRRPTLNTCLLGSTWYEGECKRSALGRT